MPSSIKTWLEEVKPGYGDRFVGAFEEVGVEDLADLAELGNTDAFEELEAALQARGAKLVQLQKIRKALVAASNNERDRGRSVATAASSPPTVAGSRVPVPQDHAAMKALRNQEGSFPVRTEKPLVKTVFGIGLPVPKPRVATTTIPSSPMGYTLMQAGDGPRIYLVHGLDGDSAGPGAAFRRVAALLGTCQVIALEYNEEARTCGTLAALASVYNQRIMQANSSKSVYIAGHSMGCILAHQMALQLQESGAQVGLLLFGAEVTWPDEGSTTRRMGGYTWLGGPIEAALAVARNLGGLDFAEAEVRALLQQQPEERDANKVQMRVYWKLCGPKDMPYEEFQHAVSTGARNMDMLRGLMWGFEPRRSFGGYTLFVLAPESPEFHSAQEVNSRHCVCLKTICVPGTGNHYSMLEGAQAAVVAGAVLSCLREQGESVGAMPAAVVPQAAFAQAAAGPGPPAPVAPSPPAHPQPAAPVPPAGAVATTATLAPTVTRRDVGTQLLGMVNSIAMDTMHMDSPLMESGFDSISISLLVQQVNADFNVSVTSAVFFDLETVSQIADHLYSVMPAAQQPSAPQPLALAAAPAQPQAQVQAQAPQLQFSPVASLPPETVPTTAGVAAPAPGPAHAAQTVAAGLEVLHDSGEAGSPLVYMVHGIDGDIWGVGASYRSLAPLLHPCHCCAFACDEEALGSKTLPQLASVYNKRVMEDMRRHPRCPVVIMGYSMGCVTAHQMALQLQAQAVSVVLVMIDFEITFPPEPTTKRVGGYEWLGGPLEAPLLMARGLGPEGQMWAAVQIEEILKQSPGERNHDMLQAMVFQEIASKRKGFRLSDFNAFVAKGGRNMDCLYAMAGKGFVPTGTFEGPSLLVLAPESPENSEPAQRINSKYCSNMKTGFGLGTHYNILSGEKAPAAARAVLGFLNGLGHTVPPAPKIEVPGLECLSQGEGPRIYMVHGIDANLYGVGQAYRSLAPMLSPCCCSAFAFDAEAQACSDFTELAQLYAKRAWQDAKFFPDQPLVVMGYSMGCVIAHAMALAFQEQHVKVTLILIDFEITWPPEPTPLRIGGYEWVGGELEAALLVCRSFGKELQRWAGEQTMAYLQEPPEQRNAAQFGSQICTKLISSRKGFTMKQFEMLTVKGGACMQRLHEIVGTVVPASTFEGETLMILAPESPENTEPALAVNGKYCSKLTVTTALGTHYNIIQQDKAMATASRCLSFLQTLSFGIPSVPVLRVDDRMEVYGEGSEGEALLYVAHGLDGGLEGRDHSFQSLASLIKPSGCRGVLYSSALLGIEALSDLAGLHLYRVFQDSRLFPGCPVFLLGCGIGCVLAHAIAVVAEKNSFPVRLTLLDFPPDNPVEAVNAQAKLDDPAVSPFVKQLKTLLKEFTPETFTGKTLLLHSSEDSSLRTRVSKHCKDVQLVVVAEAKSGSVLQEECTAGTAKHIKGFLEQSTSKNPLMDLAMRETAEVDAA